MSLSEVIQRKSHQRSSPAVWHRESKIQWRNNPLFNFPTSRSQKLASPWFWRQNVTEAKHKFIILTHFVKRDNLPRWKPLYDFLIWNEIFCDFTITSTHTYIWSDQCTSCKVRIVCNWSRLVKTDEWLNESVFAMLTKKSYKLVFPTDLILSI